MLKQDTLPLKRLLKEQIKDNDLYSQLPHIDTDEVVKRLCMNIMAGHPLESLRRLKKMSINMV